VLDRLRPAELPARIVAKLGVAKTTVVGVSSGGTAAFYMAAEYPQLVDRVIVSNAPSDPVDLSRLPRSPSLESAERRYGGYLDTSRAKPRSFWRIYVDFYSGEPGRISDATVDQMYDFFHRVPEANANGLMAVVSDQPQWIAAMNKVRAPVLILWGGQDPLLPKTAIAPLLRRLVNTDVSVLILPDVSHYPPIEPGLQPPPKLDRDLLGVKYS
jgi:pimeloyl-ACP methyl ester carboxylesterase